MDFPVWDALVALPVTRPASCGIEGEDEGQPRLFFVGVWRDDDSGHAVYTMSFNPSSPLREHEIGPRWQPRSMAADVALAFAEPLARQAQRDLGGLTRQVMSEILHGKSAETRLTVNGQHVPAVQYSIGDLIVAASADPTITVAVAAFGTDVPLLTAADPAIWRDAAAAALRGED